MISKKSKYALAIVIASVLPSTALADYNDVLANEREKVNRVFSLQSIAQFLGIVAEIKEFDADGASAEHIRANEKNRSIYNNALDDIGNPFGITAGERGSKGFE